MTSNLTLDATVNPDFGQVEADPAQLNLTAFETFLDEQRPFFLEGTGIFAFNRDGSRLFYSRRIGRAPQLSGFVDDPNAAIPAATPILGAAKLTGRLANGTSLGTLFAVTERQSDRTDLDRAADRVRRRARVPGFQERRVGARRNADGGAAAAGRSVCLLLRREAVTGGVDLRHRFDQGRYRVTASLAGSIVRGTADAIDRTQRNAVHYYNRPDAGLPYDPTRTSLTGTDLRVNGDKIAGTLTYGASYERLSPGFETNDIGFLSQADEQIGQVYAQVQSSQPRAFWRNASAQFYQYNQYTASGLPTVNFTELDLYSEFLNRMTLSVEHLGGQRVRLLLRPLREGRTRRARVARLQILLNLGADPRPKSFRPSPRSTPLVTREIDSVAGAAVRHRSYAQQSQLGARHPVPAQQNDTQWFDNLGVVGSDTTHYLFAHLDQELLSFTSRLNYTATTALSLQLYAEPFLTTGRYFRLRELASPRAPSYDDRYRPYAMSTDDASFNLKELHASAVLRWEYRPGSTVFVVWTQGRDQEDRNPGSFKPARDFGDLFGARPDNTFLVKASYWINFWILSTRTAQTPPCSHRAL